MDTCVLRFSILVHLIKEKKSWCIFSVWGWDDTGFEINKYVSGDKEANELINKWLEIYHDMPKHLSMEWLIERGFKNA